MTYKERHKEIRNFIDTNNHLMYSKEFEKENGAPNIISIYEGIINDTEILVLPIPYLDRYRDGGQYSDTSKIDLCLCKSYGRDVDYVANLLRKDSNRYHSWVHTNDIAADVYCYSEHVLSYFSLGTCHDKKEMDNDYLRTYISIHTNESNRRQGWASAIIKIAKKLFIDTGYVDYFGSMIDKENVASIELHKKLGAQEIEVFDYKKQYPEGWAECMGKDYPDAYRIFKIF